MTIKTTQKDATTLTRIAELAENWASMQAEGWHITVKGGCDYDEVDPPDGVDATYAAASLYDAAVGLCDGCGRKVYDCKC